MAIELSQTVDINLWAVLVSALSSMVIGGIWYSQLVFAKQWQKMVSSWTGLKEKDFKQRAPVAMLGSFFCYLVMAYVLAYFLALFEVSGAAEGATIAAWIALGFVVTLSMSYALYHGERKKLWAINTGYNVINLVAMGAILGAWQ